MKNVFFWKYFFKMLTQHWDFTFIFNYNWYHHITHFKSSQKLCFYENFYSECWLFRKLFKNKILELYISYKNYRYGTMLFHIPSSSVLLMDKGKITKRIKYDWVSKLEIVDSSINPGNINEYEDLIYGKMRVLSRRLR